MVLNRILGAGILINIILLSWAKKVCRGPSDTTEEFIHIDNVDSYRGCTVIKGNIRIVQPSFDGDPYYNRIGMHPDKLYAFSEVVKITGYLLIQGTHPHFTHLNYFSNLTTVQGRKLLPVLNTIAASISITYTSLQTIDFRSLSRVLSGDVIILYNPDLCYVTGDNFRSMVTSMEQNVIVASNKRFCESEGYVCSRLCRSGLCWSASHCLRETREDNSLIDLMTLMSYS